MTATLRIFTHPSCPRCPEAVRRAWELKQRRPELFELRTVTLSDKAGLDEAYAENIKTIPTLICNDGDAEVFRIVGTPDMAHLEASFDQSPRAEDGQS